MRHGQWRKIIDMTYDDYGIVETGTCGQACTQNCRTKINKLGYSDQQKTNVADAHYD